MTTDPSKSYLIRAVEELNLKLVREGFDFYLSRFVDAINDGCAADMPCMVAALRMAEKAIRDSDMWKSNPAAESTAEMIGSIIGVQFEYSRMPNEKKLMDIIEKLRKKDSGDVQEEV